MRGQLAFANGGTLDYFAARAAFTPRDLFAGSGGGGWYDPSDRSTLFQDVAGTAPVTAAGQSVALIKDKSGNGKHVSQATAASRPTYQTGGNLAWLQFDGVDDQLRAASGALTDANGQHSSGAAVRFTAVAATQCVVDSDPGVAGRVAQQLRLNAGNSETQAYNAAGAGVGDVGPAIGAAADKVMSHATTSANTEVFVDGVGNGATAVVPPMQSGPNVLTLGANSGGAVFFAGRLYAAVHVGKVLSAAERAKLVTWLAAKQGRVL